MYLELPTVDLLCSSTEAAYWQSTSTARGTIHRQSTRFQQTSTACPLHDPQYKTGSQRQNVLPRTPTHMCITLWPLCITKDQWQEIS